MTRKTTPADQPPAVVLAFKRKDGDADTWRDTWRAALARAEGENAGAREAVNAKLRKLLDRPQTLPLDLQKLPPDVTDRLRILPPDLIWEAEAIVFHPADLLHLLGRRFLLSDLFARTMFRLHMLAHVRGVEKNLSRRMKPDELRALAAKKREAIRQREEFRLEDELLQRFELKSVPREDGRGVKYPDHTKCPAHHDPGRSLSIRWSEDGKLLLGCPNGCTREQIFKAKGLDPKPDEREIETALRAELEKEFEVDQTEQTHLAALRVIEEVFQTIAGPKRRMRKKNHETEIATRVYIHMAEGKSYAEAIKAVQAEIGKPHGQGVEWAYKEARRKERTPKEDESD